MELLCPECRGPLAPVDTKILRCTIHGGQYKILFLRRSPKGLSQENIPVVQEGAKCINHPAIDATNVCFWCGSPVCATCEFSQPDGRFLCNNCVSGRISGPGEATTLVPEGQMCEAHPTVQATQLCIKCNKAICQTCAFIFPGDVVLCPDCATTSTSSMSKNRKKCAIWSVVLAIWATLSFVAFFTVSVVIESEVALILLDLFFSIFVLIPSLVGIALGFSAKERRLSTPPLVWIGIIWNAILLGLLILLILIGLTMS